MFQVVAQRSDSTSYSNRIKRENSFDRIWEAFRLYDNIKNPIIQELSIIGRYHGQYWSIDTDLSGSDGWENRRFYLGAEAVLFHHFTIHTQIKISDDLNPFYNGLYQAYAKWSPSKAIAISVGRLDFLYAGFERSISSTKIMTFERGLLTNHLLPGEVVGALAQGKSGAFSYKIGIFSGSIEKEFTSFKGGFGAVASIGYDLPLFYENGNLSLDYLYNNGDQANNAFKPYDHIVSLWHHGQSGPFGLSLELITAHGIDGNKTIFGITVLPSYIIKKDLILNGDDLEAILRYQYAVSDGENGLELQQRYEQEVLPDGFGNAYQAVYAGLNYHIYGERFKLMTGLEYSKMKDSANDGGSLNGWTYFAGVRVYF